MPATTYKTFGQFLRKLRTGRGLSVKEAAALSAKVALDSAGRFSQPYLSQLECGRQIAVSLPKLASIAAVLAVPIEGLVRRMPAQQRTRLNRLLTEARAAHRRFPEPLRRLPHAVTQLDHQLDSLIEKTARRVSLPLGFEGLARQAIREGLCWSAVLPFLDRLPKRTDAIRRFWASGAALSKIELRLGADFPELGDSAWQRVARQFLDWLVYDEGAGPEMVDAIQHWTIDLSRAGIYLYAGLLTCRFLDDREDAQFGLHDVPINALGAVRARQVAVAIHGAAPADDPRRSPPSPIERAAVDCLAALFDPTAALSVSPPVDSARLAAALRQLCQGVPLLSRPAAPEPAASGMADLLNQVLPPAANPPPSTPRPP
jgi:transcriptional regulator with XRE-family HTH domain